MVAAINTMNAVRVSLLMIVVMAMLFLLHAHQAGGDSQLSESTLVIFQKHDTLAVLRGRNQKIRWKDATGKSVSAEGVLSLMGKDSAPRMILDNTSVYLKFDHTPPGEADGTLIHVDGQLILQPMGGIRPNDHAAGRAAPCGVAYFIKVNEWGPIQRIQTFPILVK